MLDILDGLYGLFNSFYSSALWDFLTGYDCQTETWDAAHRLMGLLLAPTTFSLLMCLIYYKGIDPVHNKYKWFFGLLLAIFVLVWVGSALYLSGIESEISECLMEDEEGNLLITATDYWGFGLSQAIINLVPTFIFAFLCRFLSINNRYIPF